MRIERDGFEIGNATSVAALRVHCLGCKDCDGPCLMLMQLHHLPEIVLATGEKRA